MAATTNAAALVDYFYQRQSMPQRQAESLKRNPTMRMMKTEGELLKNSAFTVTIKTHQRYSGTHDFTYGMADENTSTPVKWTVTGPVVMYARLTIEGLLLAQTPVGTLLDIKASEMDDQDDVLLERIEKKLWSDQYDDLGQIASFTGAETDGTTIVFTLVNPSDAYNFKVGMYLEAFADRATPATAKRAAQDFRVTGIVDPVLGKIAVVQIGAGNAMANNDYLFVRGDRNNAGAVSGAGRSFPGITAFIPSTDPGSTDSFLGVNRFNQGPYLSGWRFEFKGTIKQTIKYSFMVMGRYVNRTKAKFTVCLAPGDWYLLEEELEGEIIRNPNSQQLFGTESLQVRTMWGLVDCIAIPVLREGRMYFMDWSTWTLHHLKAIPHVIDDDGKIFQRLAPTTPVGNTTAGDGIEARFRVWLHPMCDFPIANGTAPTA